MASETICNLTPPSAESTVEYIQVEHRQRKFLIKVFAWMAGGLLLTAFMAATTRDHPDLIKGGIYHLVAFNVFFVLEVIVVAFLSKAVEKMAVATAMATFIGYAAVNGIVLAVFLHWLPPEAISWAFLFAALMYGIMGVYAHFSGANLTSCKSMGLMLLVGWGLAAMANYALHSSSDDWGISFVIVVIFVGLTSYHSQDMRALNDFNFDDDGKGNKAAVVGALLLYLDFVLFFIIVIRTVNKRLRIWTILEEE